MARLKRFDYAALAAQLKKVGYSLKYGTKKRGANSPQARAAVRKAWEKVRLYLVAGKAAEKHEYRFKFVKANTRQKVKAMDGLNPKVRTPNGFFVRIPTNVKSYRIKFTGGVLQVEAVGMRGGRRVEKIYALNASKLAKSPEKEIRRVTNIPKPKPIKGRLVVNGFDSHHFDKESFADFENYLVEFYAESQDPTLKQKGLPGFHGSEAISPEQFADIFHVKLISQTPSNEKTTKIKHRKWKDKKSKTTYSKKAVGRTAKKKTVRRRRSRN